MMAWFFDAPAGIDDFSHPNKWHETMADEASGIVRELVASVLNKDSQYVTPEEIQHHAPDLAYIDPVATPQATAGETVPVAPWPAFPRAVLRRSPWSQFPHHSEDRQGNFRAAEHLGDEDHSPGVFADADGNELHLPVRDRQDEYLEWVARRDTNGKLAKVIFVAEGYDYFSALFKHDEQKVVEIYQQFTELSTITADDLRAPRGIYRKFANGGSSIEVVERGGFNPRNRFNIDPGIVHLSHRANSLGAEVNLAGVSGILRLKADGKTVLSGVDSEELLCCCQGGNPNRNSDPLISQQAYSQVKNGFRYTLANPVGLYIAGADHERVQTKDGEPLTNDWWKVVRGEGFDRVDSSRVLRLELAPPPGSGLTLEDLEVDGIPVRFAGQLADLILVHLFVTRWPRADGSGGPTVPCIGTCCRRLGTSHLVITSDVCATGYELAFPGLINSSPVPAPATLAPALFAHAVEVVPLSVMSSALRTPATTRGRKALTR